MSAANMRALAARTLAAVLGEGQSLASVLPPALARTPPRDRGLLQELCYGVCRWQPQLQALLDLLLQRPLAPGEHTVRALLLVGLYQLWHLRMPEHAAVAETVAAAHTLQRPWAVGLSNALLRNALRRRAELTAALATREDAQTAHPRWLLQCLRQDWPDDWPDLVAANNARPPFTLRINTRQHSRADYQALLAASGHRAAPVAGVDSALILDEPVEPLTLPGFATGAVSVQDAAAQLAAPLLAAEPGQRVLDACAAPGGKTGHLLERVSDLRLTALDQDPARLERVRASLQRLGLSATLLAGDARAPAGWWDGQPYERILLDAPCSASGVIRRHPDIKLLRRATDIAALAAQQGELLAALWPLLRPGGRLLYATCSVLRQENQAVIAAFLAAHADAREAPIVADWGRALHHGRQILPGTAGMDGFYYAVLVRQATDGTS